MSLFHEYTGSDRRLGHYFHALHISCRSVSYIFASLYKILLDPIIRCASDVTLKESIVILDEAHNIEDTCREGASFTFLEREIADALLSFKTKAQKIADKASEMVMPYREAGAQLELICEYKKDLNIVRLPSYRCKKTKFS